jgi:hypothetical protein
MPTVTADLRNGLPARMPSASPAPTRKSRSISAITNQ